MSMKHKVFHKGKNWYVYVILKYQGEGSETGLDGKASCKAPGNPKCNPSTWDNYTDACCSDQEKCGINEGDCNSNSECHGSLICKLDSCPTNQGFGERASCCQQPSGSYVMGMILKYSICCLKDIMLKADMVNRSTSSFFQPTPLKKYLT